MLKKYLQVFWLAYLLLGSTFGCNGGAAEENETQPLTAPAGNSPTGVPTASHPRMWLRPEDLPRLRGWANDGNPYYRDGLATLVETAKQNMDAGRVPGNDGGSPSWEEYPTEEYSLLFAFLSLIHPESAERDAYAARAHRLLMYVMDQAVKGQAEGRPFRDPSFAWNDRSRWNGRSWGLTVDWIYPYLTSSDKATIRKVFLRWCEEIRTEGRYHPEPVGRLNDPERLADPGVYRWSANNYFLAGMRNMGTMAMALDPTDDPDNQLHDYLKDAIGARLYLVDAMLRTDARGGLSPEGFEYSPQALGYTAEFLLALHTAGEDDPAKWGEQVSSLAGNTFWEDSIPAFLHSLSPATTTYPGDLSYIGAVYQSAWYGDGQKYWAPDMIGVYGPMGIYDQLTGESQQLEALRWIEAHTPAGGDEALVPERMAKAETFGIAILYFLLFDPAAAEPADPRPALPLQYFAEGIGRLLVRTNWEEEASWFDYSLGWNSIDHQQMDGNSFELYRDREWLIKRRVGYGFDYAVSDNQNTLAIQNDQPDRPQDDYRTLIWERGSRWPYNDAKPQILARSVQEKYAYVMGDATSLYNSTYEGLSAVRQAVRSILWIKGGGEKNDILVVYDWAATARAKQFKRFWLGLPASMKLEGRSGLMVTGTGQQLFMNSLLPLDANLEISQAVDEPSGRPADGDVVQYKLKIEPISPAAEVRFLTVFQGADRGASALLVAPIKSAAGNSFQGAVVGETAVLFPLEVGEAFSELRYQVPPWVNWQLITGLEPNARYDVVFEAVEETILVTIRPGTGTQTDAAGVLDLEEMK